MSVDFGRMREVVEVQEMRFVTDTYGVPVETPVTITWRWAEIIVGTADESIDQSESIFRKYEVRMRYFAALTLAHQLKWCTRTLKIASFDDPDGRREATVIQAVEKVSRTVKKTTA